MIKKKHKHGYHKKANAWVRELVIRCGAIGYNNRRKMHGKPLVRRYSIVKNRERG